MAINGRRVILGGLLAGLVNWMGTTANAGAEASLFPADFDASLEDWQLLPFLALYTLIAFVGGVVIVWLYAAVFSPRLGRGLRTAVVLGVAVWLPFNLLPAVSVGLGWISPANIISARMLVFSAVWQLFQVPIASAAGAWLYERDRAA